MHHGHNLELIASFTSEIIKWI